MKLDIEIIKPDAGTSDLNNYICKICLFNELDRKSDNDFEFIITALINGGIRKILFDLENLRYVDSSGIGKIISTTKLIRKLNGNVTITRCSTQIMEILVLIKLENFIKIFPSAEEGMNFLKFN
ncbi:MAG: STAS domain-containing protein [bacterium]|nr:STAS domain-containing protein [bacterium]